jgi:hypothetical protein
MSLFRSLFGPSRDEIWKQFAAAVGGNFTESSYWNGSKVEATHDQWTVVLDTYTVSTGKSAITYTRMRALFINPDGFYFNVYRRGIFSNLGKLLGMQDVTVGYPQFDDTYIIQGNDEAKLRRLFANKKIRDLIDRQPEVQFSARDDENEFWEGRKFPKEVDELCFQSAQITKDLDHLELLYDLFSETLDELVRMGSASANNPGVKL